MAKRKIRRTKRQRASGNGAAKRRTNQKSIETKMWCLVSQPNAVVIEVIVEPKSKGQEVLEKACDLLGIRAEADYFGLRYTGVKGQELWLNLRNPVERQVVGVAPYRFQLKVKFWVPPHLVLQESTRHQMYMQVRMDLAEGRLSRPESGESSIKLCSLLVQAEIGDYTGVPLQELDDHQVQQAVQELMAEVPAYSHWAGVLGLAHDERALLEVVQLHGEIQGMKQSAAEYWILKEVSMLENFGEEIFQCKDVRLGVGPHGINIYQPNPQKIPYTAIRSASSLRRMFQLWYLGADHTESLLEIKCDSCLSASGLYRALTEKHAFYSCDTVRGAVTAQYIRDLKGTIVSIFNESSPLGKKYVFDIRRTCREVHDNARRALYEEGGAAGGSGSGAEGGDAAIQVAQPGSPGATINPRHDQGATEKLARLVDALTCRICMDAGIDTVLFPCAHVICCHACAERCQSCPLCRSPIESAKRVYLPTLETTACLNKQPLQPA